MREYQHFTLSVMGVSSESYEAEKLQNILNFNGNLIVNKKSKSIMSNTNKHIKRLRVFKFQNAVNVCLLQTS